MAFEYGFEYVEQMTNILSTHFMSVLPHWEISFVHATDLDKNINLRRVGCCGNMGGHRCPPHHNDCVALGSRAADPGQAALGHGTYCRPRQSWKPALQELRSLRTAGSETGSWASVVGLPC